jgi:hypothetical protein
MTSKNYAIKLHFPNEQGDRIAEPYGSFSLLKCFSVEGDTTSKLNGYIIQVIYKQTTVTLPNGKELRTTQDISQLTNGGVLYSNDSYIEAFRVTNGISSHCDAFANGPIIAYDNDSVPLTFDPPDSEFTQYTTSGTVNMQGVSVYVTYPTFSNIIKKQLSWSRKKNTPANGLLYTPLTEQSLQLIQHYAASVPIIHQVEVKWDAGIPGQNGRFSNTIVKSIVNNSTQYFQYSSTPSQNGGKTKKKKKKNTTRKRQKYTK